MRVWQVWAVEHYFNRRPGEHVGCGLTQAGAGEIIRSHRRRTCWLGHYDVRIEVRA